MGSEHWLDGLSRALARPASRQQFMKLTGVALASLVLPGPREAGAQAECGDTTCPNGCCRNGRCVEGTSLLACGAAGQTCKRCALNEDCVGGACLRKCRLTTCAGGCCAKGVCLPGDTPEACGTFARTCLKCPEGYQCVRGRCTPP